MNTFIALLTHSGYYLFKANMMRRMFTMYIILGALNCMVLAQTRHNILREYHDFPLERGSMVSQILVRSYIPWRLQVWHIACFWRYHRSAGMESFALVIKCAYWGVAFIMMVGSHFLVLGDLFGIIWWRSLFYPMVACSAISSIVSESVVVK